MALIKGSLTAEIFWENNTALSAEKRRIVLAYSGGLDSTVLLHLLANHFPKNQLLIWHINHQLQPIAEKMELFCQQQVKQLELTFKSTQLNLSNLKSNIEAVARDARYAAFSKELTLENDILLTAHHSDDQIETVLLNALRGSGVSGLRGIASQLTKNNLNCIRPLLEYSRFEIETFAENKNLNWFEDPSNQQLDFDRNYIRKEITPKLKQRWPSISKSFLQLSSHQREAAECLEELSKIDFERISSLSEFSNNSAVLDLSLLKAISIARQKNLLRYWLSLSDIAVTLNLFNELILVVSRFQSEVKKVSFGVNFIGLFNNKMYLVRKDEQVNPTDVGNWLADNKGEFLCRLNYKQLDVTPHFLKRQFQNRQIPPWLRDQVVFKIERNQPKNITEAIVLSVNDIKLCGISHSSN